MNPKFTQELSLLRWRWEVRLALPSHPDAPDRQHCHVRLHSRQHLQESVRIFNILNQNKLFDFPSSSSKAGGSRSEKMDTMCIYLRLFLGMGIIWYFEILAFALTSYNLNPNIFILTDTLNMCQVRKSSKCRGCCFSLVLPKELVPFTQLVKVRRGKLVLALPSIRFS